MHRGDRMYGYIYSALDHYPKVSFQITCGGVGRYEEQLSRFVGMSIGTHGGGGGGGIDIGSKETGRGGKGVEVLWHNKGNKILCFTYRWQFLIPKGQSNKFCYSKDSLLASLLKLYIRDSIDEI
ncbi:hypothetical protein L2E82_32519 [Cichorium intybus]|uniref:Uncharacterized protein n=1 Tax=Cichorium intybus TaxID=13427 RepID=A0ACB9BH16_CICIN|nr:hypothetical protein L2E82_32519 [Cichorium intybus]